MSMEVVLWAIALAMVMGIGFGGLAALWQGTWIDEVIKWVSSAVAVSIPIFFLALLLQLIFFNFLGWFPLQGTHRHISGVFQSN